MNPTSKQALLDFLDKWGIDGHNIAVQGVGSAGYYERDTSSAPSSGASEGDGPTFIEREWPEGFPTAELADLVDAAIADHVWGTGYALLRHSGGGWSLTWNGVQA